MPRLEKKRRWLKVHSNFSLVKLIIVYFHKNGCHSSGIGERERGGGRARHMKRNTFPSNRKLRLNGWKWPSSKEQYIINLHIHNKFLLVLFCSYLFLLSIHSVRICYIQYVQAAILELFPQFGSNFFIIFFPCIWSISSTPAEMDMIEQTNCSVFNVCPKSKKIEWITLNRWQIRWYFNRDVSHIQATPEQLQQTYDSVKF